LGEFFKTLQAKIIVQFAVGGSQHYHTELDYENVDGTMRKIKTMDYLDQLMKDNGARVK
jgi:hypothetical protein